jgi:23S rRNA (cytidine1920-2'-O)/16S rRNA (cytidine1409-2'-O)-methyltransferase
VPPRPPRPLRRRLADELARRRPELDDAAGAVAAGRVMVDGRFVDNPAALVRRDAAIVVRDPDAPLRGEAKLAGALARFEVTVGGRVAAGARLVYAVDAGHGQLLGSLHQHPRVVNLEGTNLGQLSTALVPEPVEVVTLDLSYLALAEAVGQLGDRVAVAPGADLVALVKPMFELHLPAPPTDPAAIAEAVRRAAAGVAAAGWAVRATMPSPVPGRRGAVEALLHARRG